MSQSAPPYMHRALINQKETRWAHGNPIEMASILQYNSLSFIPEHCRRVRTMELQEVSSSLEQQNTLFRKGEQGKAFYIPAKPGIGKQNDHCKQKTKAQIKETCWLNQLTLGFVMW